MPDKTTMYYGFTKLAYRQIDIMGTILDMSNDGFLYEGALKTGVAEGYGRMINHDQNWYQGYFKDGLFDGQGTYWDNKLGKVEGVWSKGVVGKFDLSTSNGNVVNNTFK
mgnify:CR=1 FL=1|tara:strand:- start:181 stop:507 length:327 start_codon:yes stop_codon:yes gene_type:complete